MQGVKKALIAGILLVIAMGLAYPLAVSALSPASRSSGFVSSDSGGLTTALGKDDDSSHEDHEDQYRGHAKTKLLALINITSTNIPNTSVSDKAGLVLLKKGGNYSLLLLVKAKSSKHVYQVMANVTSLTIGSHNISISGLIIRSSLPGFTNDSQVSIEVKIGSASIVSGSYQLSGDILGLIFRR